MDRESKQPDLEPLLRRLADDAHDVLRQAYALGFADGKTAARKTLANEVRAKIETVLADVGAAPAHARRDEAPEIAAPVIAIEPARSHSWSRRDQRADHGSIRPAIFSWLQEHDRGGRPFEIAKDSGLNENTVRGTLNILRGQGVTEKRGDLWFLAAKSRATASDARATLEGSGPAHSKSYWAGVQGPQSTSVKSDEEVVHEKKLTQPA